MTCSLEIVFQKWFVVDCELITLVVACIPFLQEKRVAFLLVLGSGQAVPTQDSTSGGMSLPRGWAGSGSRAPCVGCLGTWTALLLRTFILPWRANSSAWEGKFKQRQWFKLSASGSCLCLCSWQNRRKLIIIKEASCPWIDISLVRIGPLLRR